MNIAKLRERFRKKELQDPPLYQDKKSNSDEDDSLPLVGESVDVEMAHLKIRISSEMMLDEFQSTADGFRFRGYFDSVQSDDEFPAEMSELLRDGEFVLAFVQSGIAFGGICTVEGYSSDELETFEIRGTFHTDMAVRTEVSEFNMDSYIRSISQAGQDDTEDIWAELEKRTSSKKNVLDRK